MSLMRCKTANLDMSRCQVVTGPDEDEEEEECEEYEDQIDYQLDEDDGEDEGESDSEGAQANEMLIASDLTELTNHHQHQKQLLLK